MRTSTRGLISSVSGIIAPAFFTLMAIVAGLRYPGYSHLTQAISELGGVDAPNPLIQDVNFLVTGLFIITFALGLSGGFERTPPSAAGPTLIGAFGAVIVVHAFLPCDAGCEFVTTVGSAHNVTGLLAFLSAIAGVLVLSRRLPAEAEAYRAYSVVTAAAGLVSLVLWIALGKAARIPAMNGSLQRVFAGTILLWIEVTAIRLLAISRRAPAQGSSSSV